jgi:hypothetical protein
METEDQERVVWTALAASSIGEAHRLLCVIAEAMARDQYREAASAISAVHHLVEQLEHNFTEKWVQVTAQGAIAMQAVLENQLRDESEDRPSTESDK